MEICYLRKPVLNIVDGVIAMDGNGPKNGNPFPLNCLAAGEDPSACDRVICEILKVKPEKLRTLAMAEEMGLGVTKLEEIELLGDAVESFDSTGFRFCGQEPPINMGNLAPFVPFAKKIFTSEPVIDYKICSKCEECVNQCPAEAMILSPDRKNADGRVKIDLDVCIRCYCCSESCPEGAVSVKQGWGWKFIPAGLR